MIAASIVRFAWRRRHVRDVPWMVPLDGVGDIGWRVPLCTARRAPDRAGDSTRASPVATIGTQRFLMARGTQPGDVDLIGGNACRLELPSRGSPAVEEPVIRARRAWKPRHRRILR